MFNIIDRNLLRDHVLKLAETDSRVVAGAIVGSLALSDGDRWSDIDLTFSVADGYSIFVVLEDWTINIVKEFNATQLFDLPSDTSIYRVFLHEIDCVEELAIKVKPQLLELTAQWDT